MKIDHESDATIDRIEVHNLLNSNASEPMTVDEIAHRLGRQTLSVAARLHELKWLGYVERTGRCWHIARPPEQTLH